MRCCSTRVHRIRCWMNMAVLVSNTQSECLTSGRRYPAVYCFDRHNEIWKIFNKSFIQLEAPPCKKTFPPACFSSAHLVHNFLFFIDLVRVLCYLGPSVISQAFHHTTALFWRGSFFCVPVWRRQVVGPLGLFQLCQSHTLQDNHVAASHQLRVRGESAIAGALSSLCRFTCVDLRVCLA